MNTTIKGKRILRSRALLLICVAILFLWGSIQVAVALAEELTVAKNGPGKNRGLVTSISGGIFCGEDCVESFPKDSEATLVATPVDDLEEWTGCDRVLPATKICYVTMGEDRTVIATFKGRVVVPTILPLLLD